VSDYLYLQWRLLPRCTAGMGNPHPLESNGRHRLTCLINITYLLTYLFRRPRLAFRRTNGEAFHDKELGLGLSFEMFFFLNFVCVNKPKWVPYIHFIHRIRRGRKKR